MGIFMHSYRPFISVEWSSSDSPVHAPVSENQSCHHDGINRGGGENRCQETYWLASFSFFLITRGNCLRALL